MRTLILGATSCGGTQARATAPEVLQRLTKVALARDRELMLRTGFELVVSRRHAAEPTNFAQFVTAAKHVPAGPPILPAQKGAADAHDAFARLRALDVPTLVIHGTADELLASINGDLGVADPRRAAGAAGRRRAPVLLGAAAALGAARAAVRAGRPGTVQRMTHIEVIERGQTIAYSFEDMMKYHGRGSPGGVAQAFKVLERALPLLSPDGPPQRREVSVATSFGGPGARDGFEAVLRAVTGERYAVDAALARPELGRERERFVFVLTYQDRSVTLVLREGIVVPEFIDLVRTEDRTSEQDERLEVLKAELAERTMAIAAADAYDVEDGG